MKEERQKLLTHLAKVTHGGGEKQGGSERVFLGAKRV